MEKLSRSIGNYPKPSKEKVLQFGEGNFLRGFCDWMIDKLNAETDFDGGIVVVQPIERGLVDKLNEQDGLYTLILRGKLNGQVIREPKVITSITRGINPYSDFNSYIECAKNPDLRFVISNTTEAGISYCESDKLTDAPPSSFPAKLTVLLYERFKAFSGAADKGLVMTPCELIEKNGSTLKSIVLRYASEWNLGDEFISWLENSNHFASTLVDRIVTGYPRDEVAELTEEFKYDDFLLNTAEIFHFWVIEADAKLKEELPFHKVGLDVVWTDDQTPYRERKVRILNGAHTMTVLGAYLYGLDTVGDCMKDELISTYMKKGIYEEIIPTLNLPAEELDFFAKSTIERFENPFIKHYLLSISLNSASKLKARVLPSLLQYTQKFGKLPKVLSFAVAAFMAFYKGDKIENGALIGKRGNEDYNIVDDENILQMFKDLWAANDSTEAGCKNVAKSILENSNLWGMDLTTVSGLLDSVASYLYDILNSGAKAAIEKCIG